MSFTPGDTAELYAEQINSISEEAERDGLEPVAAILANVVLAMG